MSSVEFEEPQFHYKTIDISGAVTHNTPFLIRWGIVKNLAQANLLMGIVILASIIAGIIFSIHGYSSGGPKYREDFTQDELNRMLPDISNRLPSRAQK